MSGTTPVSGTAGVTGGGAEASDVHGVKTGAQHPANLPTSGANASSTVPATAGYSGGGATVSAEHGVPTGKQYPGNLPQGSGATAGTGSGGQAQQGSVIGAGADTPMTTVPAAGAPAGTNEKPSAMDKARAKTAVLTAGVQEDLNRLREKLTVKDGVQAPPPGSASTAGQDYQPPTQAGQKTSFTDKAKAFAVKAIDHTQTALEGAKQNVTKQATAPAQGGQAGGPGAAGASGATASQ